MSQKKWPKGKQEHVVSLNCRGERILGAEDQSLCVRSVAQSCLILCGPMGCGPPGSSVHGIFLQEYRSGLPFPPPGDLPNPGIEPASSALAGGFFTTELAGKPQRGSKESKEK